MRVSMAKNLEKSNFEYDIYKMADLSRFLAMDALIFWWAQNPHWELWGSGWA